MKQTLQEIRLAIPLLVVPTAEISSDCFSLMKYLCKEPIITKCKKEDELHHITQKYQIEPPQTIKTHPIFCETFSDLVNYISILDHEQYHFFLRNYFIISFIDYTMNHNFSHIEEAFNTHPSIPKDRKAFIIYRSPDNLEKKHFESPTCLCNDKLSEIESYYFILNFLSSLIEKAAVNLLVDGFDNSEIQPPALKESKVKIDFAAVSGNDSVFASQIFSVIDNYDYKQFPGFFGAIYEMIAAFDEVKPGFIIENKFFPMPYKPPFQWMPNLGDYLQPPSSISFYLASASYYDLANMYDKCIDSIIKIILSTAKFDKNSLESNLNFMLKLDLSDKLDKNEKQVEIKAYHDMLNSYSKALINPLVEYITRYPLFPRVPPRAWDLLVSIQNRGMPRKAAVIASQFSHVYSKDISCLFIVYSLNLILHGATQSSLIQLRDIAYPMIIDLLEYRHTIPKYIFAKFLTKIFCTIGSSLTKEQQELLSKELKRCELGPEYTTNAPHPLISISSGNIALLNSSSAQPVPDLYQMSLKKIDEKSQSTDDNLQSNDSIEKPPTSTEDISDQINEYNNSTKMDDNQPNLPLEIVDVIIDKPILNIDKKRDDNGSSFLFSYVAKKNVALSSITAAVNSTVIVKYKIKNPYAVPIELKQSRTLIDDANFEYISSPQFLAPNSTCEINSYFTPLNAGKYLMKGFEFYFLNIKHFLTVPREISIECIEKVPQFALRTDLPINSELTVFDGESYPFTIWITNTGTVNITNFELEFMQPDMMMVVDENQNANSNGALVALPDESISKVSKWNWTPLKIGQKAAIKCMVVAKVEEEFFQFTLRSSNSESDYICSQTIRQYYKSNESLNIRRIFMVDPPPPPVTEDEFLNQENLIHVGFEIHNKAHTSFEYQAFVSGESRAGVIGARQTVVSFVDYKTEELKTDGSDASKVRIIALTKINEEKLGRSLNKEERSRVAQEISIIEKLEVKWKFNWRLSTSRIGILAPKAIQLDHKLFDKIQSDAIVPTIKWSQNGSSINPDNPTVIEVPKSTLYSLDVDFGNVLLTECNLDLMCKNPAKSGIMWDGTLQNVSKEGQSLFNFILIFNQRKKYRLVLRYVSKDGQAGSTPLIVNAK